MNDRFSNFHICIMSINICFYEILYTFIVELYLSWRPCTIIADRNRKVVSFNNTKDTTITDPFSSHLLSTLSLSSVFERLSQRNVCRDDRNFSNRQSCLPQFVSGKNLFNMKTRWGSVILSEEISSWRHHGESVILMNGRFRNLHYTHVLRKNDFHIWRSKRLIVSCDQ